MDILVKLSMNFKKKLTYVYIQAELKGATATEYGLVFGIFEFVIFLTSPIFGKYVRPRFRTINPYSIKC